MFSGISGLRAHQQMMDVTGNNISNVNTNGYKTSQTTFQDTLSQMVRASGAPQGQSGGTNPAQIGLGVRLGAISTNFGQGAAQTTGKSTDLMIQGDGFFVVRSGGEQLYTRAGAFDFDSTGSLVTANGNIVQGWMANGAGAINPNQKPDNLTLPLGQTLAPAATDRMTLIGNLSDEAALNDVVEVATTAYTATGSSEPVTLSWEKTSDTVPITWTVTAPDGTSTPVTFTDGKPDDETISVGGFDLNIASMSAYSGASSAKVSDANGSASGSLASYTISQSGEIIGVFTNGLKQALGQIAMANFNNVNGLEKVGGSMYRTTVNSGLPQVGVAGTGGLGVINGGSLEMSNVDLAQEFTNLVIAQRGFQANSRVITTSDELLQELVNLKR
jgi:flagellar hook protein FlgE